MTTIREQGEKRRRAKLQHIQRQVKSGKLVVRQMTAEERDGVQVFPRKLENAQTEIPHRARDAEPGEGNFSAPQS